MVLQIIEQLTRVMLSSGPRLGLPDTMYQSASGQDIRLLRMAHDLGIDAHTLTNILRLCQQHNDTSIPMQTHESQHQHACAGDAAQMLAADHSTEVPDVRKDQQGTANGVAGTHCDSICAPDVHHEERMEISPFIQPASICMRRSTDTCKKSLPMQHDVLKWMAGGSDLAEASLRCHFRTHTLRTDTECRDSVLELSRRWDAYSQRSKDVFCNECKCWQESGMLTPSL